MPSVKFPSVVCVGSPTLGFNIDLLLRHLVPSYGENLAVLGVPQLLFSGQVFEANAFYPDNLADRIYYFWVSRGTSIPLSSISGPSPFNRYAQSVLLTVAQEDTPWDVLQVPFLSTELAHLSPLFIPADNESYFTYDHRLHSVLSIVREKLLSFPMITDRHPSYDPENPTAPTLLDIPVSNTSVRMNVFSKVDDKLLVAVPNINPDKFNGFYSIDMDGEIKKEMTIANKYRPTRMYRLLP